MKQAEADIAKLQEEVDHSAYWADYAVRKDQLESARDKYRSLKYEYDIQRTLIVFVILGLAGILYVAITRGVI